MKVSDCEMELGWWGRETHLQDDAENKEGGEGVAARLGKLVITLGPEGRNDRNK